MKKRILSLVLTFAMVLSLLPVSAAAEEAGFGAVEDDFGTVEEGVTWSVEVNETDEYGSSYYTLTISGSGPMEDYVFDENTWTYNTPWADYVYNITQVVISDGVTSIGANAFGCMYYLEKLTIGKDITSIANGVFADCASSLTSIEVSSENTDYCVADSVLFGKEKTQLLLWLPGSQSSYNVPDTVRSIGDYAFYCCNSLTSVTFPDGLETIGDYAFYDCSGLTSVVFPDGLKEIGDNAFYYCRYLAKAELPDSLTVLGDYAFSNTALTSVTIPDGVTTVGASAFAYTTSLTQAVIGNGVTEIEERAFSGCTKLETVTFSGDAPEVGEYAFSSVKATCYYPQNNDTWTAEAMEKFGNTNLIWEMISYEVASGTCGDDVSWVLKDNGLLTISGTGAMQDNSSPWTSSGYPVKKVVVQEGVTTVGASAFANLGQLAEVVLADTVTKIGSSAFDLCLSLEKVDFGAGVNYIGSNAFNACVSLKKVVLEADLSYLGYAAFGECSGLKEIYLLGEYSGDYDTYAFAGVYDAAAYCLDSDWSWSYFENAYLSWETLTDYGTCGDNVVWRLSGDGKVLTIAGTGVMYPYSGWSTTDCAPWTEYATQIVRAEVLDGVTSVGGSAFYNCSALTTVYLADSVTRILAYAFRCCYALKDISIPDKVTVIGPFAFQSCYALEDITIPVGVTAIGERVFQNCDALTSVTIPENISSIGTYAFANCDKLTEIEFLGDAPSFGSYAFYKVTATAKYPADNATWTSDVMQNYGGTLTWVAVEMEDDGGEEVTNACGENLTWTLENSVLTISGTGAMYDYAWVDVECTAPWYDCEVEQVVLGDGVTTIGDYAFYETNITEITIPDGVISIGDYAFSSCYLLAEVTVPATVTSIGSSAFKYCEGLTEITLPGDSVFYGGLSFAYSGLKKITVLGNVAPSYGAGVFEGVTATVYYPAEYSYWPYLGLGDTLTWVAVGGDVEAPVLSVLEVEDEIVSGFTKITADATDDVGVTGIELAYTPKGGTAVAIGTMTESGTYTWDVSNLADGQYTITAVACDNAGNRSEAKTVTVVVDNVSPEITALNAVNCDGGTLFGGKYDTVYFTLSGSNLGGDVTASVRYALADDGEEYTEGLEFTPGETGALSISGWESGMYIIQACVSDAANNSDRLSINLTVDNTAPPAPTELSVLAGEMKNTLTWKKSTELDTRHCVYRALSETGERTEVAVLTGNEVNQSWVDTNVTAGTTYYYWVAARDALGNESVTESVNATTLVDATDPWIAAIRPVNGSTLVGTATIAVTAEDNVAVKSIKMEGSPDGTDWTEIGTVEAASGTFTVDTTQYGGTLRLRITVVDAAGNECVSEETYVYSIDNTPPEQVTGLTGTAASTVVTLNWNDVADSDFGCFVVEQLIGGEYRQIKTVSDALGVYVTGLIPDTEYTFRVYAADKLGNKGEPSAECVVSTLPDTTAPVITNIRPTPGRYNGDTTISLTFTVADDYGVGSLSVQTSYDGTDWNTVGTVNVNTVGTSVQVSYSLSTAAMNEGVVYVRAVATDWYGNASDSSANAPYTQYVIDRTAPATPTGLTATAGDGTVSLTWEQGSEDDLNTYTVYRSTEVSDGFAAIAPGLKRLYLVDTGVSVGTTYYYYIDVTDVAGNRSALSETVSAVPLADSTAPAIVSVSPSDGYVMGPKTNILVKVSDNYQVGTLYYQISVDGGESWTEAAAITVNSAEQVVTLPLVQENLTGAFQVKLRCDDAANNTSDAVVYSYGLDLEAPAAPAIAVTADNMAIQLSWNGGSEDDLSGYRVYRAEEAGSYQLLFQRSGGQSSYSYTDYSVSVDKAYSYYVEATDIRGNTSSGVKSDFVQPLDVDEVAPTAVLDGTTSGATGYEIAFTAARSVDNVGVVAYRWDFGDDTTADAAAVNHAFTQAGTYTVTVTVYDAAGYSDSDSMTVTIKDPSSVGSLTIQVKDESGQVVPNAGIYMDLGSEEQSLLYTNSMGVIDLRPEVGIHVIGVYTDGYLPAKTTVNVVAGRSESITINVVKKDIVVGELTVERMTLEQIKAAGIDVSDPANQFVYEFNIKLTYGTYEEYVSAQYNGEGETLKNPEPVKVTDSNGETRWLSINVIPVRTGGSDGTDGGSGGVGPGSEEQEVPMVVILDIPGKASWLKDFFDVRLTVINQADSEFVLDDCLAYLNVPAGLTLMDTLYTTSDPSYDMGSIAGQQSQTAHWILRGDVGGEYDLTADFTAILREFGTKISARFQTDEPFRVRQGDGLTLDLVVENAILADTDGAIKVGLRNDDEFPYYLPNLQLDEDLVTLTSTYKTNGRVKVNTDREILRTGETIWWEYVVPRENWETLTTYSGENFYLMEAIVETVGGNAELPWTVEEVMPFSINGDRIVVTRVSSGGGESEVSYLNVDKASVISAVIPDLRIRTYRKNDAGEYVPSSMEIKIKDDYIIKKGEDADGNEVGADGITITTDENGEYTYEGYSMVVLDNDKSFNIRVSASRAKPVDIPVVIRGETAETGMLTVYAYTGSGDEIAVLEGATVSIREANGVGSDDVTDTTDEDGKASFKRVPQGKQEISIQKKGYLPVTAVVDVGSDTEVSYRLYADDDPNASRIIQIKNDLSGWGTGNQTIFPEGRVTGTVGFQLTKRIAEGESFVQYHYRITDKDGAVKETDVFTTDDGFWLDLGSEENPTLKAGDKLEFAVETDNGISAFVDANLVVTDDPGFFGDLVYDLQTIQLGGKVDFTKGFEFDPSEFIENFSASSLTEGVKVEDDEKGYQAVAIEQTNTYSFDKVEAKQIYPISAKYDLSGKLTLSVILGDEKETVTKTGGSYSASVYEQTPDSVSYRGVVAVGEETESNKKKVSGQLQADFVFQYDPAKNAWSLTVLGKISAEQSFTLMEVSFLKVGYVSSELKFEESATLELARSNVGPEEDVEILGNGLIPKEMKAGGELKTTVGAKVVSKKVASVGAYVKVGLEFQLLPYLALRANAALGAEGSVLIWSKSKDLVSNTWEFSGDAAPVALAEFALYDLRSNAVDTLSLASPGVQTWRLTRGAWIANAYEQAEPQLVALRDGTILAVWCGYTESVDDPVALYWSVYQNDCWSDPVRVDADDTADLYPSLIVTDDAVQLVWVDFTGSVADMDDLTYAEIEKQAFKMLGVTTASFTGSGWTVTEAYEGGALAANPKVAVGEDGSILVAWIANGGNLEEATVEHPDSISWVLIDGDGTRSSGSVKAPYATIADLGVGYDGEAGYQLAVLAYNGDETDGAMLKLYHSERTDDEWNDLTAVSGIDSADNAMAMADDGTVYTINSGRIYAYKNGVYRHLLRSELLDEDAGELVCAQTGQGTVLLWTATLEAGSAVCMVLLDEDGVVTQPVVVAATEEGMLTAPTAAADGSNLTVMYQQAGASGSVWNHDVMIRSYALGVDLSLEDSLISHSGYLVPGAYLESYVEIDSLGLVMPESYAVEVYHVTDGTETVIGREEGGSSRNLTLKWTVPDTYAGEPMYFRVVTADGVTDSDLTNNTVELGNLIRELVVSDPVYVGRVDGKDVFTVDVENQGLVTSEATALTVKTVGDEGAILLTATVEALAPGDSRTIRLTVDALSRSEEQSLAFMLEPLTGEGDLSNNNEYLILPEQKTVGVVTESGTQYYWSLSEALERAGENDTIVLLDNELDGSSEVVVKPGVTLDLNGYYVKAENVLSFGRIVDNGDAAGGIVSSNDRTESFVLLQTDNDSLPIYDTTYSEETGCYRFYGYEVVNLGGRAIEGRTDAVKLGFRICFDNADAYRVLSETEDPGVELIAELNWGAGLAYTFSEATVKDYGKQVYADLTTTGTTTKAITLTISGLNVLGEGGTITSRPVVESVTGATGCGTQTAYSGPAAE